MPILTREVEVIPMGKAIQHYKSKGYDAKHKQPLVVKVEDLSRGSDTKIEILCDMCNKNTMMVKYNSYNRVIEKTGSYVCRECAYEKQRQNNLKKYGVPYVLQLKSMHEKAKQTKLEKYGVEYTSQLETTKEKVKQTNLQRYGVEYYSKTQEWADRVKETNLNRYGVDAYAKSEECQKKMKETSRNRYGVENYAQTHEYKERFHDTCIEKYGENYREQFQQMALNSFYEKTGYANPSQMPEVKEKVKQTFLSKYGVDNPNKLSQVREKTSQTLYLNSSQKASKQQRYICELYQGILNFPIEFYNVDIYLQNNNLVVEYDGGGHLLNVILGRETVKEFNQKEIIRNNILKRNGYNIMKIISSKDKLPQDIVLLQMLSCAKQYFLDYPQHSWIEFNIDTSMVRNTEHKNGVIYDFGKLRIIKDSDLNTKNATSLEVA